MLDFAESTIIIKYDIEKLIKYTNIDFGSPKIYWDYASDEKYANKKLMLHLMKNIINLNTYEKYNLVPFTIFQKASHCDLNLEILEHLLNYGYILNDIDIDRAKHVYKPYITRYYKFQQYLQSILKIKHPKNIPRYYHKMNLLMLITKHQKIVPKCVLLYVIIPFVYS